MPRMDHFENEQGDGEWPDFEPNSACDDCEEMGARDYGYTLLCDACYGDGDAGMSDEAERAWERRQMGIES